MKDYKNKYIKYKNKYLYLKKMIGGEKIYYIPCEIYLQTQKIYLPKKVLFEKIKLMVLRESVGKVEVDENGKDNKIIFNDFDTFYQDPLIFLKNDKNENFAIRIKKDIKYDFILKDKTIVYKYTGDVNGNNYGGNFISSPNNENSSVFYCEGISDEIFNFMDSNLNQKLVEIKCGFKFNNERHIDELMCFMPYGQDYFKIWIYKIRNIEYKYSNEEEFKEYFNTECTEEKIKYILDEINRIYLEKHTQLQNDLKEKYKTLENTLMTENEYINRDYTIIVREIGRNPEFKSLRTNIEQITKIKTLLQYNVSKNFIDTILQYPSFTELKIDKLCIYKIFLKKIPDFFDINIEKTKENLNREHQINLENISNSLFNKSYEESKEKFIMFPIDLIIHIDSVESINSEIKYPPIFNRILINSDKLTLFVSYTEEQNIQGSNEYYQKINEILTPQLELIKQYKDIDVKKINTYEYHKEGGESSVGGNLHCLIKQQY